MADQFNTDAVGDPFSSPEQEPQSSPVYLSSSFQFDSAEEAERIFTDPNSGYAYSRYANPNIDEFEQKMARLERTQAAVATASGMSAVFAAMAALLDRGDHIIVSRALFSSTHHILTSILPKWGIDHSYAEVNEMDKWESLIQDNTRMLFLETPSNPCLQIIDLEWAGDFAERHGLIYCVDNCFATPYLQKPALFGADLVVHSATKYIDGQGRALGGIIAGKTRHIEEIRYFVRHTGPTPSPFNAWIFTKSLETLPLRMDRHCDNAMKLAKKLEEYSSISRVRYPFLASHPQSELAHRQMNQGGGVLTFTVEGGKDKAFRLLNNLKTIRLSANLGDTTTLAAHPATTTHANLPPEEQKSLGIKPGMIRISCGIEHLEDLAADLHQAIERI